MSPVSDRKELLPFLSLSLLLMLFLPLLLWLEAASSDSRTRSAAVGYPEMPETLNLGLDQLAAASSIQQKKT